jgi:surface polysaccharide O-acyltransferase-like enzyme
VAASKALETDLYWTQSHTDKSGIIKRNAPIDSDRLFVNNVRFLSMAAIVAIHTIGFMPDFWRGDSFVALHFDLIQPFKFGTIAFFLVSGFLFGERIDRYSPVRYFKRRLHNVAVPWLVWLVLFGVIRDLVGLFKGNVAWAGPKQELIAWKGYLLYSSFWFVPNLLFALAILLIFRRKLKDSRIGILFLFASLFYAANIYGKWIAVEHQRAVFGFVFYLWLGAWGAWHFPEIEKRFARVPVWAMLGLVLLTLTAALAESKLLLALGSKDPGNTLRITNQIYSVVVVLAIVKLRKAVWPRFVNVRQQTFGIYLSHTLVLAGAFKGLKLVLPEIGVLGSSPLLVLPIMFFLAYASCLLIVRTLLAIPGLRWTVGLPAQKTPAESRGACGPRQAQTSGRQIKTSM